jgi:hypothetical protein
MVGPGSPSIESSPTAAGSPAPNPSSDSQRRRSQFTVILGLFVTFGGLIGYGIQVPTQPASLAVTVPWLAVGFIAVWWGGILAGNSLVAPPTGVSPLLVGQLGVAGISTLAGALSATVVVLRLGASVAPVPGTPAEFVIALAAALLAWIGGFLMGHSMRRFVRRRRRTGSY